MVPQIKLMSWLSAMNMYGLVLLYWVFALSEGCLLTVSYVNSIPTDLDEAAFIDGASVLRTFFVIIYPMMKPIISAVLIMDALWIWNDFQRPLLMLNASEDMWTLRLIDDVYCAVDDGLFDGLQSVAPADDQLAQRQDEVGLERQRIVIITVLKIFSNTRLWVGEIKRLKAERASRTLDTSKSLPIPSQVVNRSL